MDDARDALPLRYKGYIPGLDVLRGVAILLVLLYHGMDGRMPWQQASGWVRWPLLATEYGSSGVQLFFVLSGFLITGILLDTSDSLSYYSSFYARRALRILPAYLLLLTVLKFVHVISWHFVLAALLYITNMAALVGVRGTEYGSLWSLSVEEQFYLLWPFLVRRFSVRALARGSIVFLALSVPARFACTLYFPGVDTAFKLWFNADMLLSGTLLAIAVRQRWLHRDNVTLVVWALAALSASTGVVIVLLTVWKSDSVWMRTVAALYRYFFLFGYTALVLAAVRNKHGAATHRSLVSRLLAFFGYISYGLYLVHQLVFNSFDRLVRGTRLAPASPHIWSLLANTVLCILLSTAIAWLSRRTFEEFFLRRKGNLVPYRNSTMNDAPLNIVADRA